jgi:hypothetical protein
LFKVELIFLEVDRNKRILIEGNLKSLRLKRNRQKKLFVIGGAWGEYRTGDIAAEHILE